MKIIDSDNYAASGIETMFFPGGEPHVKIPRFTEKLLLHLKLRTLNDTMFAALLQNALHYQGIEFTSFIPYFPGARQDRSDGLAPLTAQVLGNLLWCSYSTYVFDPHSEKLIDFIGFEPLMPVDLQWWAPPRPVVGVIAPDAGAHYRALKYLRAFHPDATLFECSKKRDPQTGHLSSYVMPSLEKVGRYVIVDDICDGGGTFNLLASAFLADDVGIKSNLELFVSHGIFSKGLDNLHECIDHITTTDSWCQLPSNERLTVIPLLSNLMKHLGE